MKLADLEDPKAPQACEHYASHNNYKILEIVGEEEFPHFGKKVQQVLRMARENGCVEFCFLEIQQDYNIMLDRVKWRIKIIGFIPKPKN